MTSNIQHSSTKGDWMTPLDLVEAGRLTMGGIDLDPASSKEANERIKASKIYTAEDDGLVQQWNGRIFLNPPGTCQIDTGERNLNGGILWQFPQCGTMLTPEKRRKKCSCGFVKRFWIKLMKEFNTCEVTEFIWIGFSLEQLQSLQNQPYNSPADFSFCIPDARVAYDTSEGKSKQPTHASYIAYGGRNKHDFKVLFSSFGKVIVQ